VNIAIFLNNEKCRLKSDRYLNDKKTADFQRFHESILKPNA